MAAVGIKTHQGNDFPYVPPEQVQNVPKTELESFQRVCPTLSKHNIILRHKPPITMSFKCFASENWRIKNENDHAMVEFSNGKKMQLDGVSGSIESNDTMWLGDYACLNKIDQAVRFSLSQKNLKPERKEKIIATLREIFSQNSSLSERMEAITKRIGVKFQASIITDTTAENFFTLDDDQKKP